MREEKGTANECLCGSVPTKDDDNEPRAEMN